MALKVRGGRRLAAVMVSALIVSGVSTTSVGAAQAATPDSWSPAVSSKTISATDAHGTNPACADFLFVGVRGSNEHSGFGTVETAVRASVRAQLDAAGYTPTVRSVYIDYAAADLEKLFRGHKGQTEWFTSAFDGSKPLLAVLEDSYKRCPAERWIVSGYSQGALVVDRSLALFTPPASKIAGVFVVGDPDTYKGRAIQNVGSAAASARGAYDLTIDRVKARQAIKAVSYSYCNRLDAVCDTNHVLKTAGVAHLAGLGGEVLVHGMRVHGAYAPSVGPKLTAMVAGILPKVPWVPFGSPAVKRIAGGVTDIVYSGTFWGGIQATAPAGVCDYRFSVQVRLLQGDGYGVGVRASVKDGVPYANTIQYDVGAGGYKDTALPNGSESGALQRVHLDAKWHTVVVTANGGTYTSSIDGKQLFTGATTATCGGVLLRLWRSHLQLRAAHIEPSSTI